MNLGSLQDQPVGFSPDVWMLAVVMASSLVPTQVTRAQLFFSMCLLMIVLRMDLGQWLSPMKKPLV